MIATRVDALYRPFLVNQKYNIYFLNQISCTTRRQCIQKVVQKKNKSAVTWYQTIHEVNYYVNLFNINLERSKKENWREVRTR